MSEGAGMPSIGIGIGVGRGGGVPAFTTGSLAGLVLDVAVGPSWCFTDTSGTTPCGIGDTVKCVTDRKSGLQFTQSLALTTDRTLQQDASGKYYLSLGGGANDWLWLNTPGLATSQTQAVLAAATRPTAGMTDNVLLGLGAAGAATDLSSLVVTTGGVWQESVGGSAGNTSAKGTTAYTGGSDYRLIGRADTTGAQTVRLYENGSATATFARTTAFHTSTAGWSIGCRGFGVSKFYTGRLYGFLLYTADPGDAGIAQIDTYLKGLMP